MTTENWILLFRILYAAFTIGIVVAAVFWGMKTGQFKEQKKASHLPFEIEDDDNNS